MILYKQHTDDEEILGILELQKANLGYILSPDELQKEGFVTVNHQLEELKLICGPYGHTIAKDANTVIGYALTMLPKFSKNIDILKPMFDILHGLKWQGHLLKNYEYIVMGQVCVSKRYRRKGVFSGLYNKMQRSFSDHFDFVITEIATRNYRSINAHLHIGFEKIYRFSDNTDDWEIVLWDWRNNKMK